MKTRLLTIAKGAMKFFFDIDPMLTEHFVLQAATQSILIKEEIRFTVKDNIQQSRTRMVQALHPASQQELAA